MTKSDILAFISPSIVFVIVGAMAFATAVDIARRHNVEQDKTDQQQFDTFISDVQSGKRQLTTGEMPGFIKRSHSISESLWQADADTGIMMREIGWIAIGCILLQVAVTVRVAKKFGKPCKMPP